MPNNHSKYPFHSLRHPLIKTQKMSNFLSTAQLSARIINDKLLYFILFFCSRQFWLKSQLLILLRGKILQNYVNNLSFFEYQFSVRFCSCFEFLQNHRKISIAVKRKYHNDSPFLSFFQHGKKLVSNFLGSPDNFHFSN